MTYTPQIRTLIAELVHLRGELAYLLVALQKKDVISAEEFEKDFAQFWRGHGEGLLSRYLEQLDARWAAQEGGPKAAGA